MDPTALGVRLRTRRRSLGLTGEQVAEQITSTKTGKTVSQPTYSDWENGVEQPTEQWFDSLAAFLGISRNELVLLRHGEPAAGAELLAPLVERIERLEAEIRSLRLPPDPPADPESPGT